MLIGLVGEEELAGGGRPQSALGVPNGPLVGQVEVADFLNFVAKELQAERVGAGGNKHVNNGATHSHLSALLHHIHCFISQCDQLLLE